MAPAHVQTTFHNITGSRPLEQEIRKHVDWLGRFHPRIIACEVLVDVPHLHRLHQRPTHVRIALSLPGDQIIVNHEASADVDLRDTIRKSDERDGHRTVSEAIRDAFDVARRQLEDVVRRRRDTTVVATVD